MRAERFIFGIPLIARAASNNWSLVEALLELTLLSVAAQTEQDFRVVIAGHDRPRLSSACADYLFIEADWRAAPPRSDNRDSGQTKFLINQHVLESGGGLLMFLDADDWVDTRLVATARSSIGPGDIGGYIEAGYATDIQSLQIAPLPHPDTFKAGFHTLCGSSTVARLRPEQADPLLRDPLAVLHEHYRWTDVAAEHGVTLARLDVVGNYVINTSANHSEVHGPFAPWRRKFTEAVNRGGCPLDSLAIGRFGLGLERVRETSERFFARL